MSTKLTKEEKISLEIAREKADYVHSHYTLAEILSAYKEKSVSKKYILVETANNSCNNKGFNADSKNNFYPVKSAILTENEINVTNVGITNSSGKKKVGVKGLRLNISKNLWCYIVNGEPVGFHYQKVKAKKYHKWGYAAEYLVYKSLGRANEWKRDNTPFWEAGDIVINGEHYQIKTHQAIMCSLDQIYDTIIEMYGKRD